METFQYYNYRRDRNSCETGGRACEACKGIPVEDHDKDRDKTGRCRKAHGGDGPRDPSRSDDHRGDRRSDEKEAAEAVQDFFQAKL